MRKWAVTRSDFAVDDRGKPSIPRPPDTKNEWRLVGIIQCPRTDNGLLFYWEMKGRRVVVDDYDDLT